MRLPHHADFRTFSDFTDQFQRGLYSLRPFALYLFVVAPIAAVVIELR